MTREEFYRLTGIKDISDADFKVVHTLYMAAGEMVKEDFCAEIKAGLTAGTSKTYGGIACTPRWMDEVAKEIDRLDAENRRLQTKVKDLEEAAKKREWVKKSLGQTLRYLANKIGSQDLADLTVDLIGAENSARCAVENGYQLTEDEEKALTVALEELDVYRGKEVTREGERPDAAAAAGADS